MKATCARCYLQLAVLVPYPNLRHTSQLVHDGVRLPIRSPDQGQTLPVRLQLPFQLCRHRCLRQPLFFDGMESQMQKDVIRSLLEKWGLLCHRSR